MKTAVILLTFFLLGAALHSAHALYSGRDGVVLATESNFKNVVLNSNRPTMVEFFAPWCGHCKSLAPEYKKAAAAVKGMVNIVAVDCDASANRALCSRYDVKGFPTLKLFSPGKKNPEDYHGPRAAKGIVDALLGKLDSRNIRKVAANNIDEFLNDKPLPKVILFTTKAKSSHLYMALSMEFKGRLTFAEVSDREEEIAQRFDVTSFPSLIVVKNDQEQTVARFDDDLGYKQLYSFLAPFAPKSVVEEQEPPKLIHLTSEADYAKHCAEQRRLCAVGFVPSKENDETEHAKAVKILEALAASRNEDDVFGIMWVDGSKATAFRSALDLPTDLPSFAVMSPKKKALSPFRGAFTVKALGDFLSNIKSGSAKQAFPETLFDKAQ